MSESYLIWVLTGDTSSNDMAPWGRGSWQSLKINGRIPPGLNAIKHSNVFDPMKRNAHSNLTKKEKKGKKKKEKKKSIINVTHGDHKLAWKNDNSLTK